MYNDKVFFLQQRKLNYKSVPFLHSRAINEIEIR